VTVLLGKCVNKIFKRFALGLLEETVTERNIMSYVSVHYFIWQLASLFTQAVSQRHYILHHYCNLPWVRVHVD
jgi:hypothetical protein